jgi:hypothetical protein
MRLSGCFKQKALTGKHHPLKIPVRNIGNAANLNLVSGVDVAAMSRGVCSIEGAAICGMLQTYI